MSVEELIGYFFFFMFIGVAGGLIIGFIIFAIMAFGEGK